MSIWSSSPLLFVSTALLLVFVLLSAVDGIYLHLIRYRLHAQPSSWREHLWHTGRAILFTPILLLVFVEQTGGALLYAGLAVVALDQGLELLDLLDENESRAPMGGLSTLEYVLHVVITTFRTGALALALAARPASAWSLDAVSTPLPEPLSTVLWQLVPGAVIIAAVHVWLAWKHAPRPVPV